MDDAHPARFWWLKRLAPAAALVLILMFGSYFAVGVWADRRVASELGEWSKLPVIQPNDTGGTPADLADPRNPAFHVQAGIAALPRQTTEQMAWEMEDHQWPPLTERDVQVMRSFQPGLQPRVDALRAAREAAEEREYRWALGPLSVTTFLPHLNPMREVCVQIGHSMLLAHHEGDLARALELARDNRTLAESCLSYGNVIVSSLVACGIEAVAHAQLLRLASYEPAHRTLEEELAMWRQNRTQVKRLIGELMAPAFYERLAVEGLSGEWLLALSMRNPLAPGWAINVPVRNAITAPVLDVNAVDMLGTYEQYRARLAHHGTYPARIQAIAAIEMPPERTSMAGVAARGAFHEFLPGNMERVVQAYARVQTSAYAAAIALASRLFEADHGRLPQSLEELVPEYLPRMPEDPFDPAGGPLRYRVIEGLPIVYSVGPNGTDAGGSLLNPDKEYPLPNHGEDYVYPLRSPASMNHDPLKWLRERQEAQAP